MWTAVKELVGAKSELQRLRKGNVKMEEYLSKLKTISDYLFMAGSPISKEELITHALIGLVSEYNPMVVQLSYKIGLTWTELQATLLTYESRLDLLNSLSNLNLNQPNVKSCF